jgi:hypothetical protein
MALVLSTITPFMTPGFILAVVVETSAAIQPVAMDTARSAKNLAVRFMFLPFASLKSLLNPSRRLQYPPRYKVFARP